MGLFILVRGAVKPRFNSETYEYKISGIELLSEVRKNYIKTVTLNVPLYKLNEAVIAEIEKMAKNNKGKSLLKFNVYDPDTNMNIHMFSRTSKINFSDEFLTFFENDSDITFRIN